MRRLKHKSKFFHLKKVSIEQCAEQTGATQAYQRRRSEGEAKPLDSGRFGIFQKKILILAPFGSNFVPFRTI